MEDQVPSSNFPEQQQQEFVPPPLPNFEEMRRRALQDAIAQVTQNPAAPVSNQQPPVAPQYQQPQVEPQRMPEPNIVYLRRNLTLAELGITFLIAIGIVAGAQGIWHVATDVIPRIEIREK